MEGDVEIFEGLVTSSRDTRHYRAIKLSNGLTALLISNLDRQSEISTTDSGNYTTKGKHQGDEIELGNRQLSNEEEEVDKKNSRECGDTPANKYKPNTEKLSAAALCVGIGSYYDPPDLPGLSHFLEHMVFMGSEKYPDENDFDANVKKHGGSSNACTGMDMTTFYFDIKRTEFSSALDRFAHFFVKPLMRQDSMAREMKAVDSEFDMRLTCDNTRRDQILRSLACPDHPIRKFSMGNIKTLDTIPNEKGIDVYARLHGHRQRMYSSHYMTLAVESQNSLDELEQLVRDLFTHVPHNHIEKPMFAQLEDPFDTPEFYKMYKVVPSKDVNSVELNWCVPCHWDHYRQKHLDYFGWLLEHEGNGSILQFLKKKLWATELLTGTGAEFNRMWTCFYVCIVLTEAGIRNLPQVIEAVFQYLEMLRRIGPQDRIYNEQKTVAENEFEWQEEYDAIDYVNMLSENMQLYPVADYLTGHTLSDTFNPKMFTNLATSFMERLSPQRANIYIQSKSFAKEFDNQDTQKEPHYGTEYMVQDVPKDWLELWKNSGTNSQLSIPKPNDYIATDFTLMELEDPIPKFPVLISDNNQGKLWYKPDNKFHVPKAYLMFAVTCPIINNSAKNQGIMYIYQAILEHHLAEHTYAANVAGLSFDISWIENDFVISLGGFSHKLQRLLETLVDIVKEFEVSEELFKAMKTEVHKSLFNAYRDPSTLAEEVGVSVLQRPHWNLLVVQRELHSVNRQDLLAFSRDLFHGVFLYGLAQGNISPEEARNMENYILSQLGCTPYQGKELPEVLCTRLPAGTQYIRVANLNPADCNSVLSNYYQHGQGHIRQYVLNRLLMLHMDEPVVNILRTREQLGYEVRCEMDIISGILAFSITVESQANKFSMEEIDHAVESFLNEFEAEHIHSLSEKDFQTLVSSSMNLLKCQDLNLEEEFDRNLEEIRRKTFLFDIVERQIEALQSICLSDLQEWFSHLVPSGGQVRKLSVQVVGNPNIKGTDSTDTCTTNPEDVAQNSQQVELSFVDVETDIRDSAIYDIEEFRRTNEAYPVSRIM